MRHLLVFVLCGWSGLALSVEAADKPKAAPEKRLEVNDYKGWGNCLVLSGSLVRAAVAPSLGGRILEYSLNGQNILAESAVTNPQTSEFSAGYQCDIGPEIRGIGPHPGLWGGHYQSKPFTDFGVKLSSPAEPSVGLVLEKDILIDPETGDLGLTQRMRNVSSNEVSFCLWDRTLCKGGGFAFFPLKKKSHFPARWSLRRTVDGKFVYDGAKPESPSVKIMNGVLVAKCEGEATKVGADCEAGWIAYVWGRWLFVKYFPYDAKAQYSDGGNSVELYFDNNVGELEPLSPQVKLKAGETYELPEKWTLVELDNRVTTYSEARALVNRIPRSPFD